MVKTILLTLCIFSLISCSKNMYDFQIENNSNYEILKMKLGGLDDIMIAANDTSNIISFESGRFQEGIGITVEEYKHENPDSLKVYQNTFGKFYTLSGISDSKLNIISVSINFNKESDFENDFVEIELKN